MSTDLVPSNTDEIKLPNEETENVDANKKFVEKLEKDKVEINPFFSEYATEKIIPKWGIGDIYNCIFVIAPLAPIFLIFCVIFEILIFPVIVICYCFAACQTKPKRRLEGCGFQLFCLCLLPIAAPAIIVLWTWVIIVWFFSFFASMPFGIVRILFCDGAAILNNFRLIWQFSRTTPFYLWSDVRRALIGCVYRLASAFVKYAMIVNPWLYTLEIQFCNQWSPPLHGEPDEIGNALLAMISQSLHNKNDREAIDRSRFAPHYPFPPKSRRSVIGSQFGEHLKYATFTKTTFKIDLSEIPSDRSQDMERNLYFVELMYTNPFHFLAGDVYVGRRKDLKWEHPMYCLQPKVGYFGALFYSNVNELFRVFAPNDATRWIEYHAPGEQVADNIV